MIFLVTFVGALLTTTASALPGPAAATLAPADKGVSAGVSVPAPSSAGAAAAQAATSDPTVLINRAAAEARRGRVEEARRLLEIAIASQDRYDVELADGRWMDSRQVARIALSRLPNQQPIVMR